LKKGAKEHRIRLQNNTEQATREPERTRIKAVILLKGTKGGAEKNRLHHLVCNMVIICTMLIMGAEGNPATQQGGSERASAGQF
jgi:hypothetical protein